MPPSDWKHVKDCRPEDDQSVWVVNDNIDMLPIKAYYDGDTKLFLSMETLSIAPIDVTHWMSITCLRDQDEKTI